MVEQVLAGEWQRAQECLGAANLCRENGYYADAISRAYYAILHAAKAALRFRGISVNNRRSTHRAVMNHFGQHLVEPGYIEATWSTDIRQGHIERTRADYGGFESFEEVDASDACECAGAFLTRIRLLLNNSASPGRFPAGCS